MRLRRVDVGGAITNMVYDGLDRIAEYSNSVVQRRYVHGPGVDDPIVWYEGSNSGDTIPISNNAIPGTQYRFPTMSNNRNAA
jgi:hypothetical protein